MFLTNLLWRRRASKEVWCTALLPCSLGRKGHHNGRKFGAQTRSSVFNSGGQCLHFGRRVGAPGDVSFVGLRRPGPLSPKWAVFGRRFGGRSGRPLFMHKEGILFCSAAQSSSVLASPAHGMFPREGKGLRRGVGRSRTPLQIGRASCRERVLRLV